VRQKQATGNRSGGAGRLLKGTIVTRSGQDSGGEMTVVTEGGAERRGVLREHRNSSVVISNTRVTTLPLIQELAHGESRRKNPTAGEKKRARSNTGEKSRLEKKAQHRRKEIEEAIDRRKP